MGKSLKEKIKLPHYTLAEELINAISHGVGALLGIAALVLCIVVAAKANSASAVVGVVIYGTTQIILYTISTLYHALAPNNAKRVFRVLDHCTIFALIAGTYTPFCLVTLQGATGWIIFGVTWGLAVLGIVFNAVNLNKYSKISGVINLIMGWLILVAVKPLYEGLGFNGLLFLVLGGVMYSVGAILYALGHKIKFMHSVFHFFVVGGGIFHFFAIFLYLV